MSETRWTAGPWSCNLPENGYIAIECTGNRIARVDVEADDPKVVESLIANAHLIAAAPELDESHESLIDAIHLLIARKPIRDLDERLTRAAIVRAKARGEQ